MSGSFRNKCHNYLELCEAVSNNFIELQYKYVKQIEDTIYRKTVFTTLIYYYIQNQGHMQENKEQSLEYLQ